MPNQRSKAPSNGSKRSPAPSPGSAETPVLTTNQGVPISDDHNSLKAGPRGPSLLEDFVLREKITHFDHERIPERIVHARGAAAHGVFRAYASMAAVSKAKFLQDPATETPVFVRFSTVAGSRGSADTARDARGFAVKFYTEEGNYDLVGNNIPVFFIQDAMKFPDLVHAVKPEPHNEIPQASSAHDTFWDFISLMPESLHMVFWVMSDRAIPRSFRMMEGFGVHTFRFVNDLGVATFVKFHWKPLLGAHALVWDEAQQIQGRDADFHRRDLWEAIEKGDFPEYELGVQLVPESDEHLFDFDLLDPTKLIPEELVPVQRIGRMTLNRNPDNFFAETEQAAFHPGHIVPGIDFTNDPLLQGRLFSYTDTQLIRLGGPNFHQLPINRAKVPVTNHQRDGFGQQTVPTGRVAYDPNSLAGGCPFHAPEKLAGFVSRTERIDARTVRARSAGFADHVSQARLFFASQAPHEQEHITQAFEFELAKVETVAIRERMVNLLALVQPALAARVARTVGVIAPSAPELPPSAADPERPIVPRNSGTEIAAEDDEVPEGARKLPRRSPSLSMAQGEGTAGGPGSPKGRKVAILVADGVDAAAVKALQTALAAAGAQAKVVAAMLGSVSGEGDEAVAVDERLKTTSSVLFDAVFVPGGAGASRALAGDPDAVHFVAEAYKHHKTVGCAGEGVAVLVSANVARAEGEPDPGVVVGKKPGPAAKAFVEAMASHRHWDRPRAKKIPA